MSRSRKRVGRFGWCVGSNTSFYRARNRTIRHIFNNRLKKLITIHGVEEASYLILHIKKNEITKFSDWNSPTDGYGYVRRTPVEEWEKKVFRK